ncbi:hypothetical protein Gotur_007000 [Gossypium turneri]
MHFASGLKLKTVIRLLTWIILRISMTLF